MFEVPEKQVAILSTYLVILYEKQLIKASKEKGSDSQDHGSRCFLLSHWSGCHNSLFLTLKESFSLLWLLLPLLRRLLTPRWTHFEDCYLGKVGFFLKREIMNMIIYNGHTKSHRVKNYTPSMVRCSSHTGWAGHYGLECVCTWLVSSSFPQFPLAIMIPNLLYSWFDLLNLCKHLDPIWTPTSPSSGSLSTPLYFFLGFSIAKWILVHG